MAGLFTKCVVMAALMAGMAAAASAMAADKDWYVGHLGDEVCVPIRGIHDDLTRARWGGPMRTPEDVAKKLREKGLRTQWMSFDTVLGAAQGGESLREHGRNPDRGFPR